MRDGEAAGLHQRAVAVVGQQFEVSQAAVGIDLEAQHGVAVDHAQLGKGQGRKDIAADALLERQHVGGEIPVVGVERQAAALGGPPFQLPVRHRRQVELERAGGRAFRLLVRRNGPVGVRFPAGVGILVFPVGSRFRLRLAGRGGFFLRAARRQRQVVGGHVAAGERVVFQRQLRRRLLVARQGVLIGEEIGFLRRRGGAGVVRGGDHLPGKLRLLQIEDQRWGFDDGRRVGREGGQVEPDRGIPDGEKKKVQHDGEQDDPPLGLAFLGADLRLVIEISCAHKSKHDKRHILA